MAERRCVRKAQHRSLVFEGPVTRALGDVESRGRAPIFSVAGGRERQLWGWGKPCQEDLSPVSCLLLVTLSCLLLVSLWCAAWIGRQDCQGLARCLAVVVPFSGFGSATVAVEAPETQAAGSNLASWLREVGFCADPQAGHVRNPFASPRAEDSPDLVRECFVSPFAVDPLNLLLRPVHMLIVGLPGSGKSALAIMLDGEIKRRGEADSELYRDPAVLLDDLDRKGPSAPSRKRYVILDVADGASFDDLIVRHLLERTINADREEIFRFFLPARLIRFTDQYSQWRIGLGANPVFLREFLRRRIEWASNGRFSYLLRIHAPVAFDPDERLTQRVATPRDLLRAGYELFVRCAERWSRVEGGSPFLDKSDWEQSEIQPAVPVTSPFPQAPSRPPRERIAFRSSEGGINLVRLGETPEQEEVEGFKPPFSREDLPLVLRALWSEALPSRAASFEEEEWARLRSLGLTRSSKVLESDIGKRVGRELYNALGRAFHGTMRLRIEEAGQEPLPLHFYFEPEDTLLTQYPWELLYHDNYEELVLNRKVLLIRHITFAGEAPSRGRRVPLRVLYVAPRPKDQPYFERCEWDHIPEDARCQQDPAQFVSFEGLRERLADRGDLINVLHFDGHGAIGRRCRQCKAVTPISKGFWCSCGANLSEVDECGYLYFEHSQIQDKSDPVSAEDLRMVLGRRGVKLAILSGCWSATPGGGSVFNSVAPGLLMAGVPATVGMQFGVTIDGAQKFFTAFYAQLKNGRSVVEATAEGRQALARSAEWYIPALYLRGEDEVGDFFRDC